MITPRKVQPIQVAPRKAHRWGADLRQRAEEKKKAAWELERIRQARKDVERYSDLVTALSFGFRARNSGATIGEMYPIAKAKLADFHNVHGQLTGHERYRLRMSVYYNALAYM